MELQLLRPCGPRRRIQGSQSPQATPHLCPPTSRKLGGHKENLSSALRSCVMQRTQNSVERVLEWIPEASGSYPCSVLCELPSAPWPLWASVHSEVKWEGCSKTSYLVPSNSDIPRASFRGRKKASLNEPNKSFHQQPALHIPRASTFTIYKHCSRL